jgi:chromate reductase
MALTPQVLNILGIPGSLRRRSFNRALLEAAARCAPAATRVDVYDRLTDIPPFSEDLETDTGGTPEPVGALRRLVRAADGIVIATPEYNHSIPGVLKNAIDWLSRPDADHALRGKPMAVIGASAGSWGTRLAQAALRQVLYATESPVLPAPALFVRDAERLFDDAGQLIDSRTEQQLHSLLVAFAAWIPLLSRDTRVSA